MRGYSTLIRGDLTRHWLGFPSPPSIFQIHSGPEYKRASSSGVPAYYLVMVGWDYLTGSHNYDLRRNRMDKKQAEDLARNLFKKKLKAPLYEELVIENDGTIGRDMGLAPDSQAGKINFHPLPVEKPDGKRLKPPELNRTARERLERQINDLMAKVNEAARAYNNATKDALDLLEMARTSIHTEPLGEVSVTLQESSRRLAKYFPKESRTINNISNVALEVRESEKKS